MYSTTLFITFTLLVITAQANLASLGDRMGESSGNDIEVCDKIRITCWNSRGMVAAIPYLNKLLETSDIIALSEHWLQNNRLNVLMEVSDKFNVLARSSKHADSGSYGSVRGQGGVALLWRKSLGCVTPIANMVHDRVCGVRFPLLDGRTINLYSIYLPSKGSSDDFRTVLDEVFDLVNNESPSNLTVICGDFNGDVGFLGGKRSNRPPSSQGRLVANFFNEMSLFPTNLDQTSAGPVNTFRGGMGSSTVDYIAIPLCLKSSLKSCQVYDENILNTSDHLAIGVTLNLQYGFRRMVKSVKISRTLWSKAIANGSIDLYRDTVDRFTRRLIDRWPIESCSSTEIDNVFDILTSELVSACQVLPKTSGKTHNRPFWNEKLSCIKKEKVSAYRIWKANGSPRISTDPIWVCYKETKRRFRREIKRVQRDHEQAEIAKLVDAAGNNKNKFWKILKSKRNCTQSGTIAIKAPDGKTKYDICDVVHVWKEHFSKLCAYDESRVHNYDHHNKVTEEVRKWSDEKDLGFAFIEPISCHDMNNAIKSLNNGKSPGADNITAEHLKFCGEELVQLLTRLYNRILILEYIPKNFRIGTQVPLYKGKNLCSLDPNNYRGITLLTSFNKIFEIITWSRIKTWWHDEQIISPLQGACTPGTSCLHTATILQESIAVGLDTNPRVFVAYYDVAKAFDSVWIDGLFFQLRKMGLVGREWRMLYSSYSDFWCKVRVQGVYSDWYPMQCGIHQGGYLSLLKYAAFIDPLLRKIEESKVGCSIHDIPACPLGYADDMAAACLSKRKLEITLNTAYEYSTKWEYKYNAKKSAVMVYGESRNEFKKGKKYRSFMLGKDKVNETDQYDHVGVRNCLFNDFKPRTEDRVSRGRRAFNAILNSGIRKKGLNTSVISKLYWSIVVPVVTYGAELWVLKGDEIELIRKFQRYVGRKCQRFHKCSPNFSAFTPLGWISLEKVVYIKKLLFFRSICMMDHNSTCRNILLRRSNKYLENRAQSKLNLNDSPIFEILNVAERLNLIDLCLNMIQNGHVYSKSGWSKIVWDKAWRLEDEEFQIAKNQLRQEKLLFQVIEKPYYLTWWVMSDVSRFHIEQYEIMARLVCDCSLLKAHNVKYKGASFASKMCDKCDLGIEENTRHIIMQCPFFEIDKRVMFNELEAVENTEIAELLRDHGNVFLYLMGKHPANVSFDTMYVLWSISAKHISAIYKMAVSNR